MVTLKNSHWSIGWLLDFRQIDAYIDGFMVKKGWTKTKEGNFGRVSSAQP